MADKLMSLALELIHLHFPRDFGDKFRKQTFCLRLLALLANGIACVQLYLWHKSIIYDFYVPLPWSALAISLMLCGHLLYPLINAFFDVMCAIILFHNIGGWALNPRIYGRWDGSWKTTSMSILFSITVYLHIVLCIREIFRMFRSKAPRRSLEDGLSPD